MIARLSARRSDRRSALTLDGSGPSPAMGEREDVEEEEEEEASGGTPRRVIGGCRGWTGCSVAWRAERACRG